MIDVALTYTILGISIAVFTVIGLRHKGKRITTLQAEGYTAVIILAPALLAITVVIVVLFLLAYPLGWVLKVIMDAALKQPEVKIDRYTHFTEEDDDDPRQRPN